MRILVRNGHQRTLALEGDDSVLLFRYISKIGKCAIELVAKDAFNRHGYKPLSRHKPLGFLGLISKGTDIFLCVITGRIEVAQPLEGERVNRIYDVDFHCLTRDSWDFLEFGANGYPVSDDDNKTPGSYSSSGGSSGGGGDGGGSGDNSFEQHPCYELRKLLTDGSFYYSTDFDLTSTLQGRGVRRSQQLSMDRFHLDYMWNAYMMHEIIHFRNNLEEGPKASLDRNGFITTVIRGFAESVKTVVHGKKALMTIISKQSWKRAGTRYNVRGVDDEGNVANFVESELIVNDGLHAFAYSQIRGSIPLFWEQDVSLMTPKVVITRGFDASIPAFEKHFAHLNGKYGPVHIVNLLSKTKSTETELSREYFEHYKLVKSEKPDSIFYVNFDFHQETKSTYADADRILGSLKQSLADFGYYCYDLQHDETIMEQQGVFRTNCLDCLDRTNVVQQVISQAALDEYLADFQLADTRSGYASPSPNSIRSKHSVLWADQGDQISQIYTGTNALKSSFSRSGKMGFAGALSDATKSLSRIYINNFVDKGRQQVVDTLLGKNADQTPVEIFDPITDYLARRLKQSEPQFTTYEDINIFVGTYNLAGGNRSGDMRSYLFPPEVQAHPPDIYIVGFQEVIELNASSLIKNDGSAGVFWQEQVQKQLDSLPSKKYMMLRSEYMASVLLLMFVTEEAMDKITQVEGKYKKTGLGGIAANKGSVAIRFNYGSTSFCFFNSHLAAGVTNTEERYNDFQTCWNGLRFSRNRLVEHHDSVVWLGDLNYRIALPNAQVRPLIEQGRLPDLMKYDQLGYELQRRPELQQFVELPITFNPTYKYDKNSDNYDSSEKQRVPSWTDRILSKSESGALSQLCYHCAQDVRFSDHRPVYATFSAGVKLVNAKKKKELSNEYLREYRANAASNSDADGLIELNDDSSDEKSLTPSWSSSSNSAPTLIDFDESHVTASSPAPQQQHAIPVLPPRRQPPPPSYGEQGIAVGTMDTTVTPVNTSSVPRLSRLSSPDTASPSGTPSPTLSYSVMQPTRSRSGSNKPPPLPSRAPVARPVPPAPRKIPPASSINTLASSASTPATKENQKLAPIVPAKPKALSVDSTPAAESTSIQSSAPSTNQWAPMAPTRKR